MKIIMHSDDFGFDENTTRCTIDCFEKSALSSASIMANMPATKYAIDFAKANKEFSYGIHLTYVDGLVPMAEIGKISCLLSSNHVFKFSNNIRISSLVGLLPKKQIIEETKSQIGYLLDSGINISHIDSHGHIHKFPVFQRAIKEVINSFGLYKARKVQDIYLQKRISMPNNILNSLFDIQIKGQFKTTDHFYMPATRMDQNWVEPLIEKIQDMDDDKILEIGVHPGGNELWRKNEYHDILNFSREISQSTKHRIITWHNL
jgi:chitin disaccharide deacetylase